MNSLLGLDVSKWQSYINWQTAKDAGVKFAFIKCTQGKTIKDSRFSDNWAGSHAVGIPRGLYHWFEPEMDAVQQMDWFLANDQGLGELEHVLDIEDAYNIPSPTVYAARVKTALEYLTAQTGRKPIIYTRASYWKVYLYKAMGWADQYKLWTAHYKEFLGPSCCLPWTPDGWAFWQFTSSGPGPKYGTTSLEVDMNISNGPIMTPASVAHVLPVIPANTYRLGVDLLSPPTVGDKVEEARWKLYYKNHKNYRED